MQRCRDLSSNRFPPLGVWVKRSEYPSLQVGILLPIDILSLSTSHNEQLVLTWASSCCLFVFVTGNYSSTGWGLSFEFVKIRQIVGIAIFVFKNVDSSFPSRPFSRTIHWRVVRKLPSIIFDLFHLVALLGLSLTWFSIHLFIYSKEGRSELKKLDGIFPLNVWIGGGWMGWFWRLTIIYFPIEVCILIGLYSGHGPSSDRLSARFCAECLRLDPPAARYSGHFSRSFHQTFRVDYSHYRTRSWHNHIFGEFSRQFVKFVQSYEINISSHMLFLTAFYPLSPHKL